MSTTQYLSHGKFCRLSVTEIVLCIKTSFVSRRINALLLRFLYNNAGYTYHLFMCGSVFYCLKQKHFHDWLISVGRYGAFKARVTLHCLFHCWTKSTEYTIRKICVSYLDFDCASMFYEFNPFWIQFKQISSDNILRSKPPSTPNNEQPG